MRAAIPALLVGFVALFAAPARTQPEVAPPPHDKPDAARDLKLVATADAKQLEVETAPHVALVLVNTSKNVTYRVVKPGDGSEAGWREPYVHFTAERLTPQGKWEPLPNYGGGRCGLYDWKWQKDVVELKPGEKLAVTSAWIPNPNFSLPLPGKVRVRGHYEYRAGLGKGGLVRPVDERGAMGDAPAFAVASEPVEFEVVPRK